MTFTIFILCSIGLCTLFALKADREIERARLQSSADRARHDLDIRQRERNRWAALDQKGKRFKPRGK